MKEMEKLRAQGEIPEEELKAIEEDLTSSVWSFFVHKFPPT
jgi:hypothetical protein